MAKAKAKSKWTKKVRFEVAKQIFITGHLTAGALLFNQVNSDEPFNIPLGIIGVLVLVVAYIVATTIMRGGEDDVRN